MNTMRVFFLVVVALLVGQNAVADESQDKIKKICDQKALQAEVFKDKIEAFMKQCMDEEKEAAKKEGK